MEAFRFLYRASLLDVHDGDTVRLVLDRGLDGTATPEWIRLGGPSKSSPLNVYAPELAQPGGPEAQKFASEWLATHGALGSGRWPLVVETWKTRGDESKLALGRYLGNVTCAADGASLNVAVASWVRDQGYGGGIGAPAA